MPVSLVVANIRMAFVLLSDVLATVILFVVNVLTFSVAINWE